MRVHLQALGCRLNEAELESWARDFRARGIALAGDPAEADLVVINSCAVTAESVRKSRNLVRRAQRRNPNAKLVLSGCYAALSPEQAAEQLGVDLVVGNQEKERLVEIACRTFDIVDQPLAIAEPEAALLARGRQRAFIKVQDGCRYRCTYCVVTLARGEERSRTIDQVVAEVQALGRQGIQEVVLTGVHLGGYGSDSGSSLSELIVAVLGHTDMPRVRLGSVEPWDLPPDFWRLFDNPRLMPHLHLPIQSGADSVLRRMARRTRRADFIELIEQARARVKDFCVTTDVIVGFPGESDEEWRQTLELAERIGFAHIHIFAFSARTGTKAASLPLPVPREIKRQRSQALHELAAESKRLILQRFVEREFEVLFEESTRTDESGATLWSGYTPNFLRVRVASEQALGNRLLRVRTNGMDEDGEALLGVLSPEQESTEFN